MYHVVQSSVCHMYVCIVVTFVKQDNKCLLHSQLHIHKQLQTLIAYAYVHRQMTQYFHMPSRSSFIIICSHRYFTFSYHSLCLLIYTSSWVFVYLTDSSTFFYFNIRIDFTDLAEVAMNRRRSNPCSIAQSQCMPDTEGQKRKRSKTCRFHFESLDNAEQRMIQQER